MGIHPTSLLMVRFLNDSVALYPRYEVFHEIEPLRQWMEGLGDPATLSLDDLTKAIIVALRLSTLMRSGVLQHLI